MSDYKDIEEFLTDEFFDKDIQDDIRKDLNLEIEKKIEKKNIQISKNEVELNKIDPKDLENFIFSFS